MNSTNRRLVAVAVVVCGFAVGMAGLLNFFKYRSVANRLVTERLVVTGRAVENSVQGAVALGVPFNDMATLPSILERERATDALIIGIDIFDTEGTLLYSTDRMRSNRPAPAAWLAAATKSHGGDWQVEDEIESAAGVTLKNNFGLTQGYLALRYSEDRVRSASRTVARELALNTLLVFLVSAALSSLALVAVMRRLARDLDAAEAALRAGDATRVSAAAARGPFGAALRNFIQTTREAEREIADLRLRMQRGGNR